MPPPDLSNRSTPPLRALGAGILALLLASGALAAPEPPEEPTLTLSTALSEDGFFRVSWAFPGEDAAVHELQQRVDGGAWETVYRGPDLATTISGQPDGVYAYRVRAGTGLEEDALRAPTAWTPVAEATVRYHSLERAFAFFGVGALVFLATAGLILAGQRKAKADGWEGVA